MPELDLLEVRLSKGIRTLADRADTHVDAVAVANEAIGRHRPGLPTRIGRLVSVPMPIAVLIALLIALLGLSAMMGALRNRPFSLILPPAPTPAVMTNAAYVHGTGTFVIVDPGTSATIEGSTQVRGFVASSADVMDDPRVTGTGTLQLSIDTAGAVGSEWGTYRLVTADGTWVGPISGAAWNEGNASDVAGYLVGSGAYLGLTYYIHVRSRDLTTEIDGIVYSGTSPGT